MKIYGCWFMFGRVAEKSGFPDVVSMRVIREGYDEPGYLYDTI